MSFQDGWSAMHLDMPPRVPRTEYSITGHWEVLKAVTGIDVTKDSPADRQWQAAREFMRKWNFDFSWSIVVGNQYFGRWQTNMGHAEYAAGGVDRNDNITCPFTDPEQVLNFDPEKEFGPIDKAALTKAYSENWKSQRDNLDQVPTTGVYTTMLSGLIAIFGWDMLLLAAGTDQKRFGDLADRYGRWAQQFFDALAAADAPTLMVHDDMVWTSGPFIHPDWYRQYVFPNMKRYFAPLREAGKIIAFTSDGNYTQFVDDLVDAGVHGFVMEPTTDMAYIASKYGRTHFFIGNADTRILLSGTRKQIKAEVERCMAIGKSCPGFFLAVGNHIPANTPVDACLYYNECYEKLARR